ncbi:MAG: hypothetical protein AAFW98_18835, partial [Pseudomonadota bacterium]
MSGEDNRLAIVAGASQPGGLIASSAQAAGRRRTLLIGIGDEACGDHGIGPAIVRAIRLDPPDGVALAIEAGDAAQLMAAWEGFDAVLLIDAAPLNAPA